MVTGEEPGVEGRLPQPTAAVCDLQVAGPSRKKGRRGGEGPWGSESSPRIKGAHRCLNMAQA